MTTIEMDKEYQARFPQSKPLFVYEGIGTTSKQPIHVAVFATESGSGIKFIIPDLKNGTPVVVPAISENVVNTLRNVVVGQGSNRLCLVEHFLAAAAFCNTFDIDVVVNGPELPLGDGSASFWIELFSKSGVVPKLPNEKFYLEESIFIRKGEKQLMALPAAEFSVMYLMDWQHPCIGKKWSKWSAGQAVEDISKARTFGWQRDHEMLGIGGESVSLTETGFDKPLHYEDEPVRHKLLDLVGDLVLTGVNPLSIQAQFISLKGGHEMDVDMAQQLRNKLVRE